MSMSRSRAEDIMISLIEIPQTKMNSRATAHPPSNKKTAAVASTINMADIVV